MNDFSLFCKAALPVGFFIFIFCLIRYLSFLRMNYESTSADGNNSEVEDLIVSDSEEPLTPEKGILNIDYNARIVSQECYSGPVEGDDCDTQCIDNNDRCYLRRKSENKHDTSTEDLNVSDEEELYHKSLTMQCLNLDGTASINPKPCTDSSSTLSYSTTIFKEGYATDGEDISDVECCINTHEETYRNSSKFASPLTVAGLRTAVKTVSRNILPNTYKPLSDFNITNGFSSSLLINEKDLIDLREEPQMTCVEFLKEDEDENITDAEDLSVGSLDEFKPEPLQSLWEAFSKVPDATGMKDNQILDCNNSRRSSLVELLTEDETFCLDDSCNPRKKKLKKHSVKVVAKEAMSDDCLTDEELIDEGTGEWTETDESGGVRQITQIKTETSIKLEGEETCEFLKSGAVHSLRKVPKKEPSDERKSSTDSEQEDLSFSEKKSMFQRLSLTSDTLPKGNKWTTEVNMDDLPMAHGEIVHEQISFHERLRMFEPDEDNRKKIQKRDKTDQPTVYKYDFTKSPKEKPIASDFIVSELEKAEEIVKQVTEELIIEEDSLNDPNFDSIEGVHSRSEQDSAFTLERVEQEVSSLLAEVDKEEQEISNDRRRVSCSRTDSDKSSNINSRIFDMESEKGNGSSDYAALSPDAVQEGQTTTEFQLTYSEMDVTMQDGERVTVFETKTVEKHVDRDHFMEVTSEVDVEDTVDESEQQRDELVKSGEAVQGISMSGDDLGFDGDDVISRRTTTTTRIVTTVTTDGEEETQSEEHVEHEGDDLRHSVEVILNQFMSSDSDAPKLEDSTTEHDE